MVVAETRWQTMCADIFPTRARNCHVCLHSACFLCPSSFSAVCLFIRKLFGRAASSMLLQPSRVNGNRARFMFAQPNERQTNVCSWKVLTFNQSARGRWGPRFVELLLQSARQNNWANKINLASRWGGKLLRSIKFCATQPFDNISLIKLLRALCTRHELWQTKIFEIQTRSRTFEISETHLTRGWSICSKIKSGVLSNQNNEKKKNKRQVLAACSQAGGNENHITPNHFIFSLHIILHICRTYYYCLHLARVTHPRHLRFGAQFSWGSGRGRRLQHNETHHSSA